MKYGFLKIAQIENQDSPGKSQNRSEPHVEQNVPQIDTNTRRNGIHILTTIFCLTKTRARVTTKCLDVGVARASRRRDARRYVHTYIHAYIHTFIHSFIHSYTHACTHTFRARGIWYKHYGSPIHGSPWIGDTECVYHTLLPPMNP